MLTRYRRTLGLTPQFLAMLPAVPAVFLGTAVIVVVVAVVVIASSEKQKKNKNKTNNKNKKIIKQIKHKTIKTKTK